MGAGDACRRNRSHSVILTQIKTGKLPEVTSDPDVVESGPRAVLARFDIQRPVRLLGVRLDLALP
jgi:DNA polymerase IV